MTDDDIKQQLALILARLPEVTQAKDGFDRYMMVQFVSITERFARLDDKVRSILNILDPLPPGQEREEREREP